MNTKVYLVHPANYPGALPPEAYREFKTRGEAVAYWWALALCENPKLAYISCRLDGLHPNNKLVEYATKHGLPTNITQDIQNQIALLKAA